MTQGTHLAMELGGTKTVVAIRSKSLSLDREIRFKTTHAEATLRQATDWWRTQLDGNIPDGIGIASFGPIRVAPTAADFGVMLATPKPGWQGFPVARFLRDQFPGTPLALDTDVNAAALAEATLGAGKGCKNLVYITVGTGIGAGILSDGNLIHGLVHPEFGHLKVPPHPDDTFPGLCPIHKNCLEGMASGPAIAARCGTDAAHLPSDHPAWQFEAWYLAHGILAIIAMVSPEIIILGGGVPQANGLHAKVNACLHTIANGYFPLADSPSAIVPPSLGQLAGIQGAFLLAAS